MYTPSRGIPSSPYNTSNTTLLLQNLLNNTEYSIFVCAFTAVGCSLNIATNATTFPGMCTTLLNSDSSPYCSLPSTTHTHVLHFHHVGPTQKPTVLYFRVSTATNVENHQNDAAVSQFQDEVRTSKY